MGETHLRWPPGHSVGCAAVWMRLGVEVGAALGLGYSEVARDP